MTAKKSHDNFGDRVIEAITYAGKLVKHAKNIPPKNRSKLKFPRWRAGVTYDPNQRKSAHLSNTKQKLWELKGWKAIDVGSYRMARAVEKLLCHFYNFSECEKSGNPNDDDQHPSHYVYIYRRPPAKIKL